MYPSIYPSIHPSIHLTVCPSTHSSGQPGQKFLSVRLSRIHSFTNAFNTASNISTASEPYSLKNTCKSTEVEITNASKVLPAQLSFSWTKFHSPPETL